MKTGTRVCRHPRRLARQASAIEREKALDAGWRKLSPKAQMDELDKLFGKGRGASKQRARIEKRFLQAA